MSIGVSLRTIMIKTHLVGFKIRPAHLAARSKINAFRLRVLRNLRAEPNSSAQVLVTERLGPSQIRFIKKRMGLQHNKNEIELRGGNPS